MSHECEHGQHWSHCGRPAPMTPEKPGEMAGRATCCIEWHAKPMEGTQACPCKCHRPRQYWTREEMEEPGPGQIEAEALAEARVLLLDSPVKIDPLSTDAEFDSFVTWLAWIRRDAHAAGARSGLEKAAQWHDEKANRSEELSTAETDRSMSNWYSGAATAHEESAKHFRALLPSQPADEVKEPLKPSNS